MEPRDIHQVVEIDREAFPTQKYLPPFRQELKNKAVRMLVVHEASEQNHDKANNGSGVNEKTGGWINKVKNLIGVESLSIKSDSSSTNQRIIGYISLWLIGDEGHITSIVVRETHRRQGVGDILLLAAIDLARECGMQSITLEVRASNLAAQALYEKYRFFKIGIRRGYYTDDREDAIIMTTGRLGSETYQAYLQRLRKSFH